MTFALGAIMLGILVGGWRLGQIAAHLQRIEALLHGEFERQHAERLAEEGRDRQGRFLKGR